MSSRDYWLPWDMFRRSKEYLTGNTRIAAQILSPHFENPTPGPVIPRSSLSHRLFRDNENTISSWKQGPVRRDITKNIPFVGCQASARCYTTPARWQINTAITPRIQILQARRGGTPKQPKRSLELVITVRHTVLDLWLS